MNLTGDTQFLNKTHTHTLLPILHNLVITSVGLKEIRRRTDSASIVILTH